MKITALPLIAILVFLTSACRSSWTSREMEKAMDDCSSDMGEFVSSDFIAVSSGGDTLAPVSDSMKKSYMKSMNANLCECILTKLSRQMSYQDYAAGLAMTDSSYMKAINECMDEFGEEE
jgi:hypothetical protein